ncbi:uncharacterized protein LOC130656009 [Hydractinia symbiolongicarpus]|uniref:uncharacterized protein LOC130656009 n=1 Tax=Hydractinia symbiolongicarpus TaxID=13093 RepID=UPI002551619B|nr:uncharacterized protein LOC130656009 [Hydractinia symbiolongicarpus]
MLLLLAWFLWFYTDTKNQPNTKDGQEEENTPAVVKAEVIEDDVFEKQVHLSQSAQKLLNASLKDTFSAAVSDTTSECLFIDHEHTHSTFDNSPNPRQQAGFAKIDNSKTFQKINGSREPIVEFTQSEALHQQDEKVFFGFTKDNVDFPTPTSQNINKSVFQTNFSSHTGEGKSDELDISTSSDDFLESDVQNENTHVGTAKVFSQPSFKKSRGNMEKIKQSLGTPTEDDHVNISEPVNFSPHSDFLNKDNSFHDSDHISSVKLLVHSKAKDGKQGVSIVEKDIAVAPVDLQLHSDDVTPEDNEVESLFTNDNSRNQLDVQCTPTHGTHMKVSSESAGRIHSIVIKAPKSEKKTRIRCSSPRMTATSPRIRAEGAPGTDFDMVHLVVNKQKPATKTDFVLTPRKENVSLPFKQNEEVDEVIYPVINYDFVENGNPEFILDEEKPRKSQFSQKKLLTKQSAAGESDFDVIMNRRKKYVDTIDHTGRLLGQFGHRDEKIQGGTKVLSKHWSKLKDAVKKKQYLSFEDNP